VGDGVADDDGDEVAGTVGAASVGSDCGMLCAHAVRVSAIALTTTKRDVLRMGDPTG